MTEKIDLTQNSKTMIFIIFYMNICFLVLDLFTNINSTPLLIIGFNLSLSGVQYLMNVFERKVRAKIELGGATPKLNKFISQFK